MDSSSTTPRSAPARRWRSGPQWLAIAAGCVATAGALAILLHEPWTTGQWRQDHILIPFLVILTVAAGELFWDASKAHKWGSALGFAVAFTFALGMTVYSSIGAQKAASGDRAGTAEAHNQALRDKRADLRKERDDLAVARDMLRSVQAQHLAESKRGGCRASCQGIERSITVYKASITGHEAALTRIEGELRQLGGEKLASPKAQGIAEVMSAFGYDKKAVEKLATVLEAPATSLAFEVMAIAAFGFGFARNRRAGAQRPNPPENPDDSLPDGPDRTFKPLIGIVKKVRNGPVATVRMPAPKAPANVAQRPNGTGFPKGSARTDREAALADLLTVLALGQAVPSQVTLAQRWRRPESTVSDWLKRWESEGLIRPRLAAGRVKVVS